MIFGVINFTRVWNMRCSVELHVLNGVSAVRKVNAVKVVVLRTTFVTFLILITLCN